MTRPHLRALRHRNWLVVLLTVNSGATDAIGYLALGGAFTSVMTGNMVLFGLSVAERDSELLGHVLAVIAAYIGGCLLGARLAGHPADAI